MPLLQLLSAKPAAPNGSRHIRVLILTPTRELAAQVEEAVRTYGRHLRLRSTTVYGGTSMNQQIRALRQGVDILVATPGRLLDHLEQRTVNLSQVEFLVLDEADRMLDMGFIRDIRRILTSLPGKRQNLFFSATFSKEIRGLADSFLQAPVELAFSSRRGSQYRRVLWLHAGHQELPRLETVDLGYLFDRLDPGVLAFAADDPADCVLADLGSFG